MPSTGIPACDEVLEQVAVVARDFDDEALLRQMQAPPHGLGVGPRMLDPGARVGREVGVLAEDVRRADVFGQLDQEAVRADVAPAADRTAPSGSTARAVRKLSHSGDIPRSTKRWLAACPQNRQVMPGTGACSATAVVASVRSVVPPLGVISVFSRAVRDICRCCRFARPRVFSSKPFCCEQGGCLSDGLERKVRPFRDIQQAVRAVGEIQDPQQRHFVDAALAGAAHGAVQPPPPQLRLTHRIAVQIA